MRLRCTWFWAATLCLFSVTPASAAPRGSAVEEVKAAARALADEGFECFEHGQFARAVDAFSEAERNYHAPTLLFMLGQAHERLGRVHDALQAYRKVADEPLRRSAPREFFRVQKRARAMVEEISPRVPSLLISVQGLRPGR